MSPTQTIATGILCFLVGMIAGGMKPQHKVIVSAACLGFCIALLLFKIMGVVE